MYLWAVYSVTSNLPDYIIMYTIYFNIDNTGTLVTHWAVMSPILNPPSFNNTAYCTFLPNITTTNIFSYMVSIVIKNNIRIYIA